MLITANQLCGEWNRIFPDPAMTLAAVDRLVHHSTIFEMNVESYRCRTAAQRRTGANLRDNQDRRTIAAQRQSGRDLKLASDNLSRHALSRRDNQFSS